LEISMRNFLLSFAAIAACSTQPATDNSDQLDQPVGKADAASRPSGTYQNPSPSTGEFTVLTLNDDHTFSYFIAGSCHLGPACAARLTTGTYLFTHSRSHRYIRFYDDNGVFLDRYAWHLDADGTLEVNLDADTYWYSLAPQPSQPTQANQCTLDTDCSGILPQFCRVCSDGTESCAHWSCVANSCEVVTCQ
jgi:hypothetical protein